MYILSACVTKNSFQKPFHLPFFHTTGVQWCQCLIVSVCLNENALIAHGLLDLHASTENALMVLFCFDWQVHLARVA